MVWIRTQNREQLIECWHIIANKEEGKYRLLAPVSYDHTKGRTRTVVLGEYSTWEKADAIIGYIQDYISNDCKDVFDMPQDEEIIVIKAGKEKC